MGMTPSGPLLEDFVGFVVSTVGGARWSVTQNTYAMDTDPYGGINIISYDDRLTSSDSSEVMYARSMDGGNTWMECVISDHRFKPKPIVGASSNYQGHHIALKASGSKFYALRMDDFSSIYQIWMAILTLSSTAVDDSPLPETFTLQQYYPNPFTPSAESNGPRIAFSLHQAGFASLKVYDVLGRGITTHIHEKKHPGCTRRRSMEKICRAASLSIVSPSEERHSHERCFWFDTSFPLRATIPSRRLTGLCNQLHS